MPTTPDVNLIVMAAPSSAESASCGPRHWPKEVVHEIDLVNEVEQDRPTATTLTSPPFHFVCEVWRRLDGGPQTADCGDVANTARVQDALRGKNIWIETSMVANEEFDIVLLSCIDQDLGGFDIGTDWLLAQDVYASFCELRGEWDMSEVRCTDDGDIRSIWAMKQVADGGIEGCGMVVSNVFGGRTGVYDCYELCCWIGRDVLAVPFAYEATATNDGYFQSWLTRAHYLK